MTASSREGLLARRIRELEEEERRLRQSMKDVNRHLRKLERGAPDSYDGRTAAWPPGPSPVAPEVAIEEGATRPTGAVRPSAEPAGARPEPRADKKFASYFSSGSFAETRPLGRERKQQRSRAILMVIFVLLVGFLVYHLIF